MPPAGIAVALGVSLATATIISSVLVSIALTIITTVVGMLLQRKPKKNPLVMDDRTITVRQPLTPRQVVQGGARVGGTIFLLERITGDEVLIGITWAGEEITAIDSIYADDEQIFINADGSAFGTRAGEIEVYHHLGSDDQVMDETFHNLIPKLWTDDHRCRGRAYSAIVIYNLAANWDNNIPNFSASIRGRKLYDPRTNATGYSTNSALAILKFLTDERYGYGKRVRLADIDINNFAAEANICDEEIALTPWEDTFTLESTSTFTVNTGTEFITFASIGPNTGDSIYVSSTVTLPAPLVVATQYFVRKNYQPSVYPYVFTRTLHPTLADAENNTNIIDFTTTGTGVHTAFLSNTRFVLTGDTMGFAGNAATDVIVPDEFVWVPETGGGNRIAVVVLETTGTFVAQIVEGTKYKWNVNGQQIYDYPTGLTFINYAAGSTGTFTMRFLAYGRDIGTAQVNATDDTIDLSTAGAMGAIYNGMPLVVRGAGTVPTPLVDGDTYFAVIVPSSTQFIRLASSASDAAIGRYIDLTDTGADTWWIETGALSQKKTAGMTTGMACEVYPGGGGATLPTPLVVDTTYYIIRTGHASFSLATSRANAFAGTAINIVDAGVTTGGWNIRLLNEPRYTANGVFDTDQDKGDVLRGLLSSCAGKLITPVGNDKWKLAVGAYRLPLISLSEADAVDGITLQARRPRRDACNTVKGTFAGPVNFDQPASLPVVSNANYIAEDGGEELAIEVNLPFTDSEFMGVRILTIEQERRRKQRTLTFPTTLEKGLQIELTDGVDVNWLRLGYVNKSFEVAEWQLDMEGGGENEEPPLPRITLELVEMGPEVYRAN